MSKAMTVRFWGTRGSHPVPGGSVLRFGGNTPCVEIAVGEQTIILDAGSGIINLGRHLMQRAAHNKRSVTATILFTHMHHDHTQGFPFFGPAYVGSSHLYMFGPSIFERELEELLARTMLPPSFPVGLAELPSLKEIATLRETDMITVDSETGTARLLSRGEGAVDPKREIVIKLMRSYAHPEGVLIYAIEWAGKKVVYATDTEGYVLVDQRLARFASDADVLIHDAQYTNDHYLGRRPGSGPTQGWGHSTPQMACGVAQAANVKQLVLFHHEPQYDDALVASMEQEAQTIFPNTIAAYEGLTIELG